MRNIFVLMFVAIPNIALCQEVFVDTVSNRLNISLGALNENLDSLKTLEDGKIAWKPLENLEQRDLLSGSDFIAKIFNQNLSFILKGDEPFWKAEIANGRLNYTNVETGKTKESDVVIHTAKRGMNPRFYFMFKTLDGSVWGVVNYRGWNPRDQQICECDISDEISLYETYVFMDGEIWRGCVSIESNRHIGIVVDRQTIPSGCNKIVHNTGYGRNLADCLFDRDIFGHYQYSKP